MFSIGFRSTLGLLGVHLDYWEYTGITGSTQGLLGVHEDYWEYTGITGSTQGLLGVHRDYWEEYEFYIFSI